MVAIALKNFVPTTTLMNEGKLLNTVNVSLIKLIDVLSIVSLSDKLCVNTQCTVDNPFLFNRLQAKKKLKNIVTMLNFGSNLSGSTANL